jgi:pyroglutamyl-peptidase
LESLKGIHQNLKEEGLNDNDNLLLVHLGVRNDIKGFRLERVGHNEASFEMPDERAFQPQGKAVSRTNPDTSFSLFSTMPLPAILQSLHAPSQSDPGYSRDEVSISSNPGRFVCNYLYFSSMDLCLSRGHAHSAALFVHLPPFSCVKEDAQLRFLRRLLDLSSRHFPQPS